MNIDFKNLGQSLGAQFQGLAGRHPGLWPIAPRLACALGVSIAVVALGYVAYWEAQFEDQDKGAVTELKLKEEYKVKMGQAINLPALREQKIQVDRYVGRLEKQLPSKAEMAALLSEINTAGGGRGLTFESFKPGTPVVRDYYAEQPIDIKIVGSYNDIGAFAGDMANMQRIVTLNNMNLSTAKDGNLVLEAVAKTFRYLDPEEVQAQRKTAEKNKKDKKETKK
ncbi:MAG: type 4a pilus biogenesis protein PilO [Pseudomonadota bacterium]